MRKKRALTAAIVTVLVAIYVVGFFLVWDCFLNDKVSELMDTDFYATEEKPISPVTVGISFGGDPLTETEEAVIGDYFTYYLAGIGGLTVEKLSPFFGFECEDELFDHAVLRYEIFASDLSGISYDSCQCSINVTARTSSKKKNNTTVSLSLSMTTNGGYSVTNESHTFVIDNKSGRISAHESNRAIRGAFLSELDYVLAKNGYTKADMAYTYYNDYIEDALSGMKKRATDLYSEALSEKNHRESELPAPEYEYDRIAAMERALSGSSGISAHNDVSFTSECLFSAGIPMDSQGEKDGQWKWYGEELNEEREKKGHSKSWIDRESFYNYAVCNSGFGLSAFVCGNGEGEIGDIIQLLSHEVTEDESGAKYEETAISLQCIITGIVKNEKGETTDYIVCTNSCTSIPLRLLGTGDFRIIKILGYNTANL